jgi:hypothetical protein
MRLIELLCGLAAGVFGLLIAALQVLLNPFWVVTTTSNGTSTTTMAPGAMLTFIVAVLLGILALGVATGAFLHVQRHLRAGLLLLLISTGLFFLGMLLGGPAFWIGDSVVLLLALISAGMALISVPQATRT